MYEKASRPKSCPRRLLARQELHLLQLGDPGSHLIDSLNQIRSNDSRMQLPLLFPFVIICAKRCSGGFCLVETQERSIATCFDHNAFASFATSATSASCHALVVVVDLTHSVIEALHSNQFKPITSRPSIISLLSLEVACTLFVGSVSLRPALAARAPPAVLLFAILNLLIDIGCEPL